MLEGVPASSTYPQINLLITNPDGFYAKDMD